MIWKLTPTGAKTPSGSQRPEYLRNPDRSRDPASEEEAATFKISDNPHDSRKRAGAKLWRKARNGKL